MRRTSLRPHRTLKRWSVWRRNWIEQSHFSSVSMSLHPKYYFFLFFRWAWNKKCLFSDSYPWFILKISSLKKHLHVFSMCNVLNSHQVEVRWSFLYVFWIPFFHPNSLITIFSKCCHLNISHAHYILKTGTKKYSTDIGHTCISCEYSCSNMRYLHRKIILNF